MKICNTCGAVNQDDTVFCANCGGRLDDSVSNNSANYSASGSSAPQAKKQSGNLIPILIAAVIMVAIVVAGVVVIALNKNKNDAPQPVQTTVATTQATTEPPTTTQAPTTQPPTTQAPQQNSGGNDVKVYIYPGYQGNSSAGDGYEYVASDGYLFPSDTQYLTESYLNGLTRDQIALIRNEIYARHGYIFKKSQFREYFNSQSWYSGYDPDMSRVEQSFNYVEKENIKTLVRYEKKMGWR